MAQYMQLDGTPISNRLRDKLWSVKGAILWSSISGALAIKHAVLAITTLPILVSSQMQSHLSQKRLRKNVSMYFGEKSSELCINKKPDKKSITTAEHLLASKKLQELYGAKIFVKATGFVGFLYFGVTPALGLMGKGFDKAAEMGQSGNTLGSFVLGAASLCGPIFATSYFVTSCINDDAIRQTFKNVARRKWVIEDMPPPEKVPQSELPELKRKFGILAPPVSGHAMTPANDSLPTTQQPVPRALAL